MGRSTKGSRGLLRQLISRLARRAGRPKTADRRLVLSSSSVRGDNDWIDLAKNAGSACSIICCAPFSETIFTVLDIFLPGIDALPAPWFVSTLLWVVACGGPGGRWVAVLLQHFLCVVQNNGAASAGPWDCPFRYRFVGEIVKCIYVRDAVITVTNCIFLFIPQEHP